MRSSTSRAREVEERIARLYEDMVAHLEPGSEEARFFARMAAQEHMHAGWVDEMQAAVTEPEREIPNLGEEDFSRILQTVDDVHDEVVSKNIRLDDALEIIIHMENSTAEEFYLHLPESIPGLPPTFVERMARSCLEHVKAVSEFRAQWLREQSAESE